MSLGCRKDDKKKQLLQGQKRKSCCEREVYTVYSGRLSAAWPTSLSGSFAPNENCLVPWIGSCQSVCQAPLFALATTASITFMLATASSSGVGASVSFKMAWENRSP